MLSVVPIKSSSVSNNYYLQQDGGYYIENKDEKSLYQWFGKGAQKLGLSGNVDPNIHQAVYSGELPNGEKIGKKMPDGSLKGRPGYDLTFSLNKDLSLIICCSQDKTLSACFLQAHTNAVKTALYEVERYVQARVTQDGQTHFENTGNMVASLCTHFSSRAGDPDVHTHALVANATERSDGKWRALATDMSREQGFYEMLRDNAVFFGSIYQNEMALACKQKGFTIEPAHKHGMFKIKNFPDAMRDHFSKRRKQIKVIVSTLDHHTKHNKKVLSQVAQFSRSEKEKINTRNFMAKSKLDMQHYLNIVDDKRDFDAILQDCKIQNTPAIEDQTAANQLLRDAIDHHAQFSVVLEKNKILSKAIVLDVGKNSHQALAAAFQNKVDAGILLKIQDEKYTTQALLDREFDFMNAVKRNMADGVGARYDKVFDCNDFVDQVTKHFNQSRLCVIREPKKLSEKQAMLSTLISSLKLKKKNVTVLTLNKAMSNGHNDYARKDDISIWRRLKNIGQGEVAQSINSFLYRYGNELKTPFDHILSRKGKEVFIVDDAQRIGFDAMQKLLTLTEQRQAKLIFLKHHEGVRGPLAGNPLALIEKAGVKQIDARFTFAYSKVRTNAKVVIAQSELQSGDNFEKQLARQTKCAQVVVSQYAGNLNNTLVLSASKKSAEKLNLLIREELIAAQQIDANQAQITVSRPVFLNKQQQQYATSYPKNIFLKEYVGRGQYRTRRIASHDTDSNKVILQAERGKCRAVSVSKLSSLLNDGAQLYREKTLSIVKGDYLRLTQENKQTDLLNIKLGESYQITEMDKKHVVLQSKSNTGNPLRIKTLRLNGLPLAYDYARSVHEPIMQKNVKHVVCDLSSHAVNAHTLSDISRHTDHIHIITDNKEKAVKHMDKIQVKQNAVDLNISQQQNTLINETSMPKDVAGDLAPSAVTQENDYTMDREIAR